MTKTATKTTAQESKPLIDPVEREWWPYEFPWGDTEAAEYYRDADRVIVRYADMPKTFETSNGEVGARPILAPGVMVENAYVVWSWMNERVMFLMADLGDGTSASWQSCGKCAEYWEYCKCHEGLHESRMIQWSRKRYLQGWVPPKDVPADEANLTPRQVAARRAEQAAETETAEQPQKSAPRRRGTGAAPATEKPSQGRTGRAKRTRLPDEAADYDMPAPSLGEIDESAGGVADDLLDQVMSGSTSKPRKRAGTTRKTASATGRSAAPRRKRT